MLGAGLDILAMGVPPVFVRLRITRPPAALADALVLALQLLDALVWRGQVFRHGAAKFFDGLANFSANFVVGAIGGGLAAHLYDEGEIRQS